MALKSTNKKNKHLTFEDRKLIEDALRDKLNFKSIAHIIGKDPTTVSYEIKHHLTRQTNRITDDEEPCPILLKPPFVCNGCDKRYTCHHVRFYYRAAVADKEYRAALSESREGIPLNKEEFYITDRIISDGLEKG